MTSIVESWLRRQTRHRRTDLQPRGWTDWAPAHRIVVRCSLRRCVVVGGGSVFALFPAAVAVTLSAACLGRRMSPARAALGKGLLGPMKIASVAHERVVKSSALMLLCSRDTVSSRWDRARMLCMIDCTRADSVLHGETQTDVNAAGTDSPLDSDRAGPGALGRCGWWTTGRAGTVDRGCGDWGWKSGSRDQR
jgi:hypothetical protein